MSAREKPILMSDAMVKAILEGRKTVTRRLVKTLPSCIFEGRPCQHSWPGKRINMICSDCRAEWMALCPYEVGQKLWVREAWAHYYVHRHGGRAFSEASDDGYAAYRADGYPTLDSLRDHVRMMSGCDLHIKGDRWQSPMFMPRWASRITLEIESVRIEKLQDISEEDAKAEGMKFHDGGGVGHSGWRWDDNHGYVYPDCRTAFAHLWDSLYADKVEYQWASNPFCWVLTFRRITKGAE